MPSAYPTPPSASNDPNLWLEAVESEQALQWAQARNDATLAELTTDPRFKKIQDRALSVLDSSDRIPYVIQHGAFYYNFWTDADHVRGVWRRTTLEEYRKPAPAWETVLDLDALAAAENTNWVWKGATFLPPGTTLCLLHLSRGGADAATVREFNLVDKTFVEQAAFNLAEAKSHVAYRDQDLVYVGTDLGPDTLTTSGYPRQVRLWKRGTPIAESKLLYEARATDIGAWMTVYPDPNHPRHLLTRTVSWNHSEHWLAQNNAHVRLPVPVDAEVDFFQELMLIQLRSDWELPKASYPTGALLSIPLDRFLAGDRNFEVLYAPKERASLQSFSHTQNYIILNLLENVRGRVQTLHRTGANTWTRTALPVPDFGEVHAYPVDEYTSDAYFMTATDYLTPTTLYFGTLGQDNQVQLKKLPPMFDASNLEVSQHQARSKDGTLVPYFQISPRGMLPDGSHPTLLYGYGGFEVSMTPAYSGTVGVAWLEQGGVYVVANIRGGGEFGPSWHQAALKEHRQRAYDDFAAVAEDLIARGITAPKHLGIMGGSNGGLLVGVMLTQRPELFGGVVCQVPLLDMQRYHKLLSGASWMDEYGNPDEPQDWEHIARYSPYQNVHGERTYPRTLFLTSTRDDRVHPGHARKMAARMLSQGHDVLYYENLEGGHGGAATNSQRAHMLALAYTFLLRELP